MFDGYFVAGIREDYLVLSGTNREEKVTVDKNGIEGHKYIDDEKICLDCQSWNLFDSNLEEHYCPVCD